MGKSEETRQYTITTYDNPWDPWTHYDEWEAFDLEFGYKTWQKVAKIALLSPNVNETEDEDSIDFAINELCELLPAVYTRVYRT